MLTKQRHSTPDSACRISCVGGARVLVEEGLGGQDDAAQAEAALGGLFVDERLLNRMRLLGCPEALERRDRSRADLADRRDTRADRTSVGEHRARAALALAAAELRPAKGEIVAQDVEQRRRGIDVDRLRASVNVQVSA